MGRVPAPSILSLLVDPLALYALLPSIQGEDPLHIPSHRHQAPLAPDLVEPAQQELAKAENRLDDAEHRLRDVFALSVELLATRRMFAT